MAMCCLATESYAKNYHDCSATVIAEYLRQVKITNPSPNTFISCIQLKHSQQDLLAISRATQFRDDEQIYDLNIYSFDHKKLITTYQNQNFTVSSAFEFETMKFDLTPYSTLSNKIVVGLKTQYSHHGGINPYKEYLSLFLIQNGQPIQQILDELPVYEAENVPSAIDTDRQIKRVLHLKQHISNGLQDIILTEYKTRLIFKPETIEPIEKISKQTHLIKFNKVKYQFDLNNFFNLNEIQ